MKKTKKNIVHITKLSRITSKTRQKQNGKLNLLPFIGNVRAGLAVHVGHPGAAAGQVRPDEGGHFFRTSQLSGRHPGQSFPGSRNRGHGRVVLVGEGTFGGDIAVGGDGDVLRGFCRSSWLWSHL